MVRSCLLLAFVPLILRVKGQSHSFWSELQPEGPHHHHHEHLPSSNDTDFDINRDDISHHSIENHDEFKSLSSAEKMEDKMHVLLSDRGANEHKEEHEKFSKQLSDNENIPMGGGKTFDNILTGADHVSADEKQMEDHGSQILTGYENHRKNGSMVLKIGVSPLSKGSNPGSGSFQQQQTLNVQLDKGKEEALKIRLQHQQQGWNGPGQGQQQMGAAGIQQQLHTGSNTAKMNQEMGQKTMSQGQAQVSKGEGGGQVQGQVQMQKQGEGIEPVSKQTQFQVQKQVAEGQGQGQSEGQVQSQENGKPLTSVQYQGQAQGQAGGVDVEKNQDQMQFQFQKRTRVPKVISSIGMTATLSTTLAPPLITQPTTMGYPMVPSYGVQGMAALPEAEGGSGGIGSWPGFEQDKELAASGSGPMGFQMVSKEAMNGFNGDKSQGGINFGDQKSVQSLSGSLLKSVSNSGQNAGFFDSDVIMDQI